MPPGVTQALALSVRPSPWPAAPCSLMGTDLYLHFLHPFELLEQSPEVCETILHAGLLKVLLGHLGQNLQHLFLIRHLLLLLLGRRGSPGRKWVPNLDLVPFSEDRGGLSQP